MAGHDSCHPITLRPWTKALRRVVGRTDAMSREKPDTATTVGAAEVLGSREIPKYQQAEDADSTQQEDGQ